MKTKLLFPFIIMLMAIGNISAQSSKTDTVIIRTSAICEDCKERIERGLTFVKGVKEANLDLVSANVTVLFNPQKTNPEKIREAISKTGYDADDVKADTKAYKNLPGCCKKDSDEKDHPH